MFSIGTNRKVKKAPSAVKQLTVSDFDKFATGDKGALVEFYAPWCGHCKQLTPTYEELGKVFAGESNVVIAKVDATEEEALGSKYEIQGFPTIKWFPPGESEPEAYEQGRSLGKSCHWYFSLSVTASNSDCEYTNTISASCSLLSHSSCLTLSLLSLSLTMPPFQVILSHLLMTRLVQNGLRMAYCLLLQAK